MKLKKISLHNLPGFKFRGIEMHSLHTGLNVVVGPNGSGKTSICQAACKLLWPEKSQYLSPGFIHSEWGYKGESFTISIEDGLQRVSQNGKQHLLNIPEASLATCFNVTIDDLFDSKDQEFAEKILLAIARGCDVKTAQERIMPIPAAKSAIAEWKRARSELEQYREAQEELRQEGNELPALEKAIGEADGASALSQQLQKIIDAKKTKQKYLMSEAELATFPKELLLSKIDSSDWKSYQSWIKKEEELQQEILQIDGERVLLEASFGSWERIDIAEAGKELDNQFDRIARLQQLQVEKDRIKSHIAALAISIKEDCRLLGFTDENEIENIKASYLDELDEQWKAHEHLKSEVAGIEEQLRLNSAVETELLPAQHDQEVALLIELVAIPQNSIIALSLMTFLCVVIVASLFFLSPTKMTRLLTIGLLIPLVYFWITAFQYSKQRHQLNKRCETMTHPLKIDATQPEVFKHLQQTIKAWGKSQYSASQRHRKIDLHQLLEYKLGQQKKWKETIFKKAQEAGLGQLPECRYRFTDFLKQLHHHWIKLKIERSELEQVIARFDGEWSQWMVFVQNCGETSPANVYELGKVCKHIKQRIDNLHELYKNEVLLKKKKESLAVIKNDLHQLLAKTNCLENPNFLKTLVEKLPEYQQMQQQVKLFKDQFEELSFALGEALLARIQEDLGELENEKRREENRAKTLQSLSEKKGTIIARIDQMANASNGQRLNNQQNQAFEAVQNAGRDFARKGLMEHLIAEVQKDFQRDCQPKMLQNAAHWFQKFTKNKYVLQMPSSDTGEVIYEAIETATSERKLLSQLSRGTRMQLLMAVRLSIAFESEIENYSLPIFLDEVLSNTDSERFDAILEVINDLVNSGRQVFYFTCNTDDAWRWKERCPEAHLIDLALLHKEQAFLTSPIILPKNSQPSIQLPSDPNMKVLDYALELRLPSLNINQPVEMTPIHYLVDNSQDLFKLLNAGINNYGNLKHLRSELLVQSFPHSQSLMLQRGELIEMFFKLKTQGRGKVLIKSELAQAGVSETYQERLWEVSKELHGDAKQLIAVIRGKKDERTKGFLAKTLEQLNGYLIREGYIDTNPILSDEELRIEFLPKIANESDRLFVELLLAHSSISEGTE